MWQKEGILYKKAGMTLMPDQNSINPIENIDDAIKYILVYLVWLLTFIIIEYC